MNAVPQQRGFTLVEMVIVIAMVAILAAIALPNYTNQILKTKIKAAESDLISLSLAMENYYQLKLAYPKTSETCTYTPPASSTSSGSWTGCNSGWTTSTVPWTPSAAYDYHSDSPTHTDYFSYSYICPYSSSGGTCTSYTLSASGSGRLSGCSLTITSTNIRSASGCPAGVTSW